MNLKICKDCKQKKPLTEFYKEVTWGAYKARCKPCFNIDRNKHRKQKENPQ